MDTTKPLEEKPIGLVIEADGPDAQAKKKKKKSSRKKKILLDIGAGEFVPTFNFSADPVSEPVATPKKDVLLPPQKDEPKPRPKKPKVKIQEAPVVIEPKKEEKEEEAAKPKKKTNRKKKDTTFNIDAPVFTPSFNPEVPAEAPKSEVQLPRNATLDEDFGGYQNRHLNPVQIKETCLKTQIETEEAESKKVYSVAFMLSLRQDNKARPVNMALLDFPHKKRKAQFRQAPLSEIDKFNRNVGQIRILLNKLSESNFHVIQEKLLQDFEYTPSLLYELMKIIFMKSTTEHSFLEIYVRLCVALFNKFKDKENVEMNFRKLLLTRCEKQFYKMLKVETEERNIRKTSIDEGRPAPDENQAEFNKQMLHVFDQSEIKFRLKEQMFGNMHLIVELYKYGQIKSNIITMCIDDMFVEINGQNVEILCQMLFKLATFQVAQPRNASHPKQSQIDLEWIDCTLTRLFKERDNMELNSRIRFCIQDLIDSYNKTWRAEIIKAKQEAILLKAKHDAAKQHEPKGRSRRSSKVAEQDKQGFMQVQKVKEDKTEKPQTLSAQTNSMYSLLSGLKPEAADSHSDDEDAMKLVDRKISLNMQNVIGLNLEKYNDLKPSKEVKRMITNLFMEYNESGDVEHCANEYQDIQAKTGLQSFVFLGYLMNNAFAMDPQGWQSISTLVLDFFYADRKLISPSDLIEGVNVSLANFVDILIDYPNSKLYAFGLFDKLTAMQVMSQDQNEKYKLHCQNLEDVEYN